MFAPKSGIAFRDMLADDRFYYGAEVVTTRGIVEPDAPGSLVDLARGLLDNERFGWISITDNPGGAPMLPPDFLADLLPGQRDHIVLHLTCKDMNRNALEGAAWRYASQGYQNILALTGDYPTTGYGGIADPVFDLDSVALIALLRSMNDGMTVPGRGGKEQTLPATDFFAGCCVSPFKRYERELVPQYFKLARKIGAGARWVIPQLGYDMRKFNEVRLFLQSKGLGEVPVIGNVYLLTKGVARLFHSGKLAGCVVSDALWEKVQKYAAGDDKGRKFFRELAAKQLACFKGLGFAAGYLGGIHKLDTFCEIVDLAESFAEDDWRQFIREIQFSHADEFFLFDHDPATGLGDPTQLNPVFVRSLDRPPKSKNVTLMYRLSRWVHSLAFTRDKGLWGLLKRIYGRWDKKPGVTSNVVYSLEKGSKALMYGCQDCGSCSLPDTAYICPMQSCSKHSRNGPCGGSADGRCELDDKDCLWARAYDRLKYYGESEQLLDGQTVLYDASLKHTSAWANTYLDRDHHGAAHQHDPAAQPNGADADASSKQTKGTASDGN